MNTATIDAGRSSLSAYTETLQVGHVTLAQYKAAASAHHTALMIVERVMALVGSTLATDSIV